MLDYKARRLAGEQVCLACGHYSSAMTCWLCVQRGKQLSDDVQYFQDQIVRALQIPKEYLGYVEANPMAISEDYWLCGTCHTEMRSSEGCLVCDVCGSSKDGACERCGYKSCACSALGYSDEPIIDCSLRHLAQAIFDTDPEVLAFVEQVGEVKHAKDAFVAKKRALDIAWERDERGWATRARERAAAIKGAL